MSENSVLEQEVSELIDKDKMWADLSQRLVNREVGYDLSDEEDVVYLLKSCGAWKYLGREWLGICLRFSDQELCQGSSKDIDRLKINEFRLRVRTVYTDRVVTAFLQEIGAMDTVINKAFHKKFLKDGSWISNGVRFGA